VQAISVAADSASAVCQDGSGQTDSRLREPLLRRSIPSSRTPDDIESVFALASRLSQPAHLFAARR